MMYVSGETAEPSTDTTGMIEEIVRQQVIEMVGPPSKTQPSSSTYLFPSSANAPNKHPAAEVAPSPPMI